MKINSYDILRKHFPESQYALMQEVRDAAGFNASRSADYMAMGLWPSRGLSLHGIEQKASRTDWLNELKKPEKADVIFKYCDFWWLFTTQEGIAKLEEIPSEWGWMSVVNGKVKIIKEAPKLTPCVMDRSFLASLLKRAVSKEGFVTHESISDKVSEALEKGKQFNKYKMDQMEEEVKRMNEAVKKFREFTGIDLFGTRWNSPNIEKISEAVNFIAMGGIEKLKSELRMLETTSTRITTSITNGINIINETQEKKKERAIKKESDANYKLEL